MNVPLFITNSPAVSCRPFAALAVQPPMSTSQPDSTMYGSASVPPSSPMINRPSATVTYWNVSAGESP